MYPIIPADRVDVARQRFPKLAWPLDRLGVGQAFIVPIDNGRDPDGRPVAYLRVAVNRAANKLSRQFTCAAIDGGLAISRIA